MFSLIMRNAQSSGGESDNIITSKLEGFEIWLMRLSRYSKRNKLIKSDDLKEMSLFMDNFYKKSRAPLLMDH